MDGKYHIIDGQKYTITKSAATSVAASSNGTIVAATDKKIRVIYMTFSGSTTFHFEDGTSHNLSGTYSSGTSQLFSPYVPLYFETPVGEALNVFNDGGTNSINVTVWYITY